MHQSPFIPAQVGIQNGTVTECILGRPCFRGDDR